MLSPVALSTPISPATRRLLSLRIFVGLCVVCAVFGVGIALAIASHVPDEGERRTGALALGEAAATSFGTLIVRDVDQVAGLSADDLGGTDHAAHAAAINDLTTDDQAQIIAHVLVTNTSRRAVPLAADAFRVIADTSDAPIAPLGDTLAATNLWPGASVDLAVRFAVPRDNANLWLEFHDGGGASAARIALGTTDQGPAPTTHQH